ALAAIPDTLSAVEAAPLLCAGITTYNSLRHSGALPGDLVAVQGIGGLGHLGIQFANKFGYKVAAIGRGSENAALAKKLGASVYIDSKSTKAAEELQKLGGAQVILATAPSSKAMSELIDGLGPNGKLMVIGATFDPIEVTPVQLISGSRTIQGWAAGTPQTKETHIKNENHAAATTPQIHYTRRSPASWRVTFNHPPLNIFGPETIPQLNEIITALETDEHVKVVVVDSAVKGFFLTH